MIKLRFKETCTYETEIDWPDNQPLPEIGTDGDSDWFTNGVDNVKDWQKDSFCQVDDRELISAEEVEVGDDVCDLCMTSEVHVERTTPCGKKIGIECGCNEGTDTRCNDPDCEACSNFQEQQP